MLDFCCCGVVLTLVQPVEELSARAVPAVEALLLEEPAVVKAKDGLVHSEIDPNLVETSAVIVQCSSLCNIWSTPQRPLLLGRPQALQQQQQHQLRHRRAVQQREDRYRSGQPTRQGGGLTQLIRR